MPEMRAGTEEEAATLALGILRQPPIATLADNSSRARAAKRFFASTRDRCLRREPWNFATAWNTPAQASGKVHPSALKNVHKLPDDCLKVRFVEADNVPLGADEWAIEDYPVDGSNKVSCLITNATAPLVCYTELVTAVSRWDAEFLFFFACELARIVGPQLGISTSKVAQLIAEANEQRQEAARSDAREKAHSEISRSTSWTRSRRIGAR